MTAIIVAGVAGTAITADLGARKIREELDALQVLGVDPIKNLVVPRFLALILITGLLDVYALLFGISGGIFAELALRPAARRLLRDALHQRLGDRPLGIALKRTMFGGIIADRLLLQGDECVRRRRGRRQAVNEAVVIALLGIFAFNYVFTQTLLATHPEISVIK